MNVDTLLKNENKLLERTEYSLLLQYDKQTPSKKEVREAIKSKLGSNPELLVIKQMQTLSGRKSLKIKVFVYNNAKMMEKLEPKFMLKRNNLLKEEPKQENQPKEENKAEQKPPAKKQESKKE